MTMRCFLSNRFRARNTRFISFMRARNPVFWPKGALKIVDSVLCFVFCNTFARWVYKNARIEIITAMRCSIEFYALFFVTHLQDGLTKKHALRTLPRCVALSSLRLCFCKTFARWVSKHTRTEHGMIPGWHATKTQYNMRKPLEKMQQHRFRTKMNYNQSRGRLTAYTWVLKSGLCSTFNLNNLWKTCHLKMI